MKIFQSLQNTGNSYIKQRVSYFLNAFLFRKHSLCIISLLCARSIVSYLFTEATKKKSHILTIGSRSDNSYAQSVVME